MLDTIVFNYRITKKIGEGGFGDVYLAEHESLGRRVAVKVLHAEFSRSPELVDRFFNEAKAVCAIGHRAIIDIQNFGRLESGQPFYLMEFFAGITLSDYIGQRGRLAPEELDTIFPAVVQALKAAHDKGIIHRDLKPENIMLRLEEGRAAEVKLLDFGIAKLLDSTVASKSRTGMAMGTPQFMAPEQAKDAKNVDVRADVYSFGATLYHCLAGRPPFVAPNITELIIKIHTEPAPKLREFVPGVPPALEAAVDACLSKSPEDRPATITAAWDSIVAAIGCRPASEGAEPNGSSGQAARAAPAQYAAHLAPTVIAAHNEDAVKTPIAKGPGKGQVRRLRRVVLVGVAIAVLLGLGLGWTVFQRGSASSTSEAAGASNAPQEPNSPPDAGPSFVELTLNVQPKDATVSVDGQVAKGNPIQVERGKLVALGISAPGFVSQTKNVTLEQNQSLDVSLVELASVARAKRAEARKQAWFAKLSSNFGKVTISMGDRGPQLAANNLSWADLGSKFTCAVVFGEDGNPSGAKDCVYRASSSECTPKQKRVTTASMSFRCDVRGKKVRCRGKGLHTAACSTRVAPLGQPALKESESGPRWHVEDVAPDEFQIYRPIIDAARIDEDK